MSRASVTRVSTPRFATALTALLITATPFLLLAWLYVLAVADFHDLLAAASVAAVWWQLRAFRREERATERAWRRIAADRAMHAAHPHAGDGYATGPITWPQPAAA